MTSLTSFAPERRPRCVGVGCFAASFEKPKTLDLRRFGDACGWSPLPQARPAGICCDWPGVGLRRTVVGASCTDLTGW